MSERKWTKGPWEVEGIHVFVDDRVRVCCGRGRNECCGETDIEGDRHLVAMVENECDAPMVASSTDLYEALREAVIEMHKANMARPFACNEHTLAKARAALQRAEGEGR